MNNISPSNLVLQCGPSIPLLLLPPEEDRLSASENFDCQTSEDPLICPEVLFNIFWQCVGNRDKTTLLNLGSLNKYHYACVTDFANQSISLTELFKHCGKIEFLEQEAFHLMSALPKILCTNFNSFNDVENEAGGVAFYYKERTMDELSAWGSRIGITIDVSKKILAEDRLLPKEEPHFCIATQGIFTGSRGKTYGELKGNVEVVRGCQMLTARKAVYIMLRIFAISNGEKCFFMPTDTDPFTHTYTSTPFGNPPNNRFLFVGFYEGGVQPRLLLNDGHAGFQFDGTGGQWQFGPAIEKAEPPAPCEDDCILF